MTAARRLLDVLEPRLPGLARAIGTPAVRGATSSVEQDGTLWRAAASSRALVVYLTDATALSRWLAGSVATRSRSLVLVPPVRRDAAATDAPAIRDAIEATRQRAIESGELTADAPIALVAEGAAATLALAASRGTVSRLALLHPTGMTVPAASGADTARVPTTLIQASAAGSSRAEVVALDRALRSAGTAVRETEYAAVTDGWSRYPKVSTGSRRALDDLVAFLDRGIGEASTFDVIPGWELH